MKPDRLHDLLAVVREDLAQLSEGEFWRQYDEHQPGDIARFIGDMGVLDARSEGPASPDACVESSFGDLLWLGPAPSLHRLGPGRFSAWSSLTGIAGQCMAAGGTVLPLAESTLFTTAFLGAQATVLWTIPERSTVTWALNLSTITLPAQVAMQVLVGPTAPSERVTYSDADEDLEWAA